MKRCNVVLNDGSYINTSADRMERLLGVDRCYELEEKFQRKETEQQISLFDLLED